MAPGKKRPTRGDKKKNDTADPNQEETDPKPGTSRDAAGSPSKKYRLEVPSLECPVCLEIPRGKVLVCMVGHHICERCFNRMKQEDAGALCPVGKCQFHQPPARNLFLEHFVADNDFSFTCTNSGHGCTFTCRKEELSMHETTCHFREIKCLRGIKACDKKIPRCLMPAHYAKDHPAKVSSKGNELAYTFDNELFQAKNRTTWSGRQMSAQINAEDLPFYCFFGVNVKYCIISVRVDKEDRRYHGLKCKIQVDIPNSGDSLQYTGTPYDLEATFNLLMSEEQNGIHLSTEYIKKKWESWPEKSLKVKFDLFK